MVHLANKVSHPHSPEAMRKKAIGQIAGFAVGNLAAMTISSLPMMLAGISSAQPTQTTTKTTSTPAKTTTVTNNTTETPTDNEEEEKTLTVEEKRNHFSTMLKEKVNITAEPNSLLIDNLLRKEAAYRTIYPNKTDEEIDAELCKYAQAYEAKRNNSESDLSGTAWSSQINSTLESVLEDEELNTYIEEHYETEEEQSKALDNAITKTLKRAFSNSEVGIKYDQSLSNDEYNGQIKTTYQQLSQEYIELLDDNSDGLLSKIEFLKGEMQNKFIALGDSELEALDKADTLIRALEEGDLDLLYQKINQHNNGESIEFTDEETLLLQALAKWNIIDTSKADGTEGQDGIADKKEIAGYLLAMSKSADSNSEEKDYILDAADYYKFDIDIETNSEQVQRNIKGARTFLEQ